MYGRDESGLTDGDGLVGSSTFILIDPTSDFRRVYLGGQHSVVFDREARRVAASANMCTPLDRQQELSRQVDPLANNGFYGFGLTPFSNVRRLLPNHFLDLSDFSVRRHWPKSLPPVLEDDEGLSLVITTATRILNASINDDTDVTCFLSAGKDSRAVLALVKGALANANDVRLKTSYGTDLPSRIDKQAARKLARRSGFALELTMRKRFDAGMEDVLRHHVRIGEAHGDKSLANASRPRIPEEQARLKLGGAGGEIGRAYYWPEGEPEEMSPELLIAMTHQQDHPLILEAAEDWLRSLPEEVLRDTALVLDLAYIEIRGGCWGAASNYLYPGSRNVLNPFNETAVVEAMIRLPRAMRLGGSLQPNIVEKCWPELSTIPYNSPTSALHLRKVAAYYASRVRQRLQP